MGQALRRRRGSRNRRGGSQGRGTAHRHYAKLTRCRSLERRNRVLRRRSAAGAGFSGFGNAAVRQLLGASRHHLGAARHLGGTAARAQRRVAGGDRYAAAAPGAAQLCRGLLSQGARRRNARSGRAAGAAGAGRLCRRDPGGRPRRIRGSRFAPRCVSDGLRQPLPHRPARPGRRDHSPFRPGYPTVRRQIGPHPVAARAGNAAQSRRGTGISPPLSPAIQRRPLGTGHLPRRERRAGARRPRVLSAAIFRSHLPPVRIPAAEQHAGRDERGRRLGGHALERHRRAARTIAARPASAHPGSGRTVSHA